MGSSLPPAKPRASFRSIFAGLFFVRGVCFERTALARQGGGKCPWRRPPAREPHQSRPYYYTGNAPFLGVSLKAQPACSPDDRSSSAGNSLWQRMFCYQDWIEVLFAS
jgi:hypothetical protein